jgi:hypothetical protein
MISRRHLLYSMAVAPVARRSPHGSSLATLSATRHRLALLPTNQVQHPSGCGATGNSPCGPDRQSYVIFFIREGL